ncbi:hypothetical protein G7Y89_g11375 [Cudoniella acicularis]|uniref:Uncharacterized protein n=1 Tax=Cudoniella acicularis TaxID=354080 RepID=A0A8H4RDT2_9HELO|nr:hypothetical protein G7Y89_g11375 [Cudoniella acicularis]
MGNSKPRRKKPSYRSKYGKAEDIIEGLGYPKGSEIRNHTSFRNKVAQFRKDYIQANADLVQFPLDFAAPEVIACADSYLRKHHRDFSDSRDAERYKWPVYPRDEQRIRETVSNNIEVHLNYSYPLEKSDENWKIGWLFKPFSRRRIEKVDPFVYRYLHEHNLYHTRVTKHHIVSRFFDDLKRHYQLDIPNSNKHSGISLENLSDTSLRARCKVFITQIVPLWMEYSPKSFGFLEERDGVIQKSSEFEKAWRTQRQEWIKHVHRSSTDGVLEWNPAIGSQENQKETGMKRGPGSYGDPNPYRSKHNPLRKRQRTEHDGSKSSSNSNIVSLLTPSPVGKQSDAADIVEEAKKAAEAEEDDEVPQLVPVVRSHDEAVCPPTMSATDWLPAKHSADPFEAQKHSEFSPPLRTQSPREVSIDFSPFLITSPEPQVLPAKFYFTEAKFEPADNNTTQIQPAEPFCNFNGVSQPASSSTDAHKTSDPAIAIISDVPTTSASTATFTPHAGFISNDGLMSLSNLPDGLNIKNTPPIVNREQPPAINLPTSTNLSCPAPTTNNREALPAALDSNGIGDEEPSEVVSKKTLNKMTLAQTFTLWGKYVTLVISKYSEEEEWKKLKEKLHKFTTNSSFDRKNVKIKDFFIWVLCGDKLNLNGDEEVVEDESE